MNVALLMQRAAKTPDFKRFLIELSKIIVTLQLRIKYDKNNNGLGEVSCSIYLAKKPSRQVKWVWK
jgi:hypothetical protein